MRPIDADALRARHISVARYFKSLENGKKFTKLIGVLVKRIDEAPTLDYAPVRHGEWVEDWREDRNVYGRSPVTRKFGYVCSLCGRKAKTRFEYCRCGALMDGGKDDG